MLTFGAALSLAAALLHVAVIIGGPSWYHLFGAGKRFVRAAERGSWYPPLVTSAIALVLCGWSLYALSGAGVILISSVVCLIYGVVHLIGLAQTWHSLV
nr:hypothetical protein [Pseudomonas cremoricolorata]